MTDRDKEIVNLAVGSYPWSDGDVELGSEGDAHAMVSEGEDNGAYVRAWVWISFEGTPLDKDKPAKPRHRVKCNQRFSASSLKPGVEYTAFSPDGEEILGTYEMIPGRAEISYFTKGDEHGVAYEHQGGTELFWDGAETQTGPGERIKYLCREGMEWYADQLWFEEIAF